MSRESNREWMKKYRLKKGWTRANRQDKLIAQGRCPQCEIILDRAKDHDCSNSWGFGD